MGRTAAHHGVQLHTGASAVRAAVLDEGFLVCLVRYWHGTDKLLTAFDRQVRRHPQPELPGGQVERDDSVIRSISVGDGWTGVTWSDLDEANANSVIAAQVSRFAELARSWEWKHYYDQPSDLCDRLLAAGFTPEAAEALLVAEIPHLTLDAPPPPGVELRESRQRAGCRGARVGARRGVWRRQLLRGQDLIGRSRQPAQQHNRRRRRRGRASPPIAAGRVEFHPGTDFASLWGGGTLPAWRGRGAFRSLVAERAILALARGFRYLLVDASPRQPADSRASRFCRAGHDHAVHAPRRGRLTMQPDDPRRPGPD